MVAEFLRPGMPCSERDDVSAVEAIRVRGIGKRYDVRELRPGLRTLKGHLGETIRRVLGSSAESSIDTAPDFWALRDLSFSVRQGEAVAIVGRNGSGKTTLLQILARAVFPTEGEALIRGRVAPLLAMGAGFNPEFTGRENITMSAVLLGLSMRESRVRMKEIIEFADIGRFIETPVKRYSSGMYIRLAFAVAAHVDAEILLADEVLAVGDTEFQDKCMERMTGLVKAGSTLIFVSHNAAAIQRLCPRAIYLSEGMIRMDGSTSDVLKCYREDLESRKQVPSAGLSIL